MVLPNATYLPENFYEAEINPEGVPTTEINPGEVPITAAFYSDCTHQSPGFASCLTCQWEMLGRGSVSLEPFIQTNLEA